MVSSSDARQLLEDPSVNKSLSKALRILTSFTETKPEWSVSDLARHLRMSKSSVSTMLSTLAMVDLLYQSPVTSRYQLGLRCLELGYLSSSRLFLRDLAYPYLEELHGDSNLVVYMAIPYQGEVLYIEALYPTRRRINYSSQGRRAPMYCTGIGKAMLAFLGTEAIDSFLRSAPFQRHTVNTIVEAEALKQELDETHRRGYAIDRQEREEGIQCVAAPVRSRDGRAVAAISISGSANDLSDELIPATSRRVVDAARDISRKIIATGY